MPDLAAPAPPFPLKPRTEWTDEERERFDAAVAKMAIALERAGAVLQFELRFAMERTAEAAEQYARTAHAVNAQLVAARSEQARRAAENEAAYQAWKAERQRTT
jgi:hypothetical protein